MNNSNDALLYRNFTKEELLYKKESNEESFSKFAVLNDGIYQLLYLDYFNLFTKIDTNTKNTKSYSLFGQPSLTIAEDMEENISQIFNSQTNSTLVTKIHNPMFIDSCIYIRNVLQNYTNNFTYRHTAVAWVANDRKEEFREYLIKHEKDLYYNVQEIDFNHDETISNGFSLYLLYGDLCYAYNQLGHFFVACTDELSKYYYSGKHDIPYLVTLSLKNSELCLLTNLKNQTVYSFDIGKVKIIKNKEFPNKFSIIENIVIKEGLV